MTVNKEVVVKRDKDLREYLYKVTSEARASIAYSIWEYLNKTIIKLEVPDIGVGPNDQLMYIWDNGPHHFELEMLSDGTNEIFYRNRVTGELWNSSYTENGVISNKGIEKLNLFLI